MARPLEKEKAQPVNLYLSSAVRRAGAQIAFQRYDQRSLSWLVERLLAKEIKRHRAA